MQTRMKGIRTPPLFLTIYPNPLLILYYNLCIHFLTELIHSFGSLPMDNTINALICIAFSDLTSKLVIAYASLIS